MDRDFSERMIDVYQRVFRFMSENNPEGKELCNELRSIMQEMNQFVDETVVVSKPKKQNKEDKKKKPVKEDKKQLKAVTDQKKVKRSKKATASPDPADDDDRKALEVLAKPEMRGSKATAKVSEWFKNASESQTKSKKPNTARNLGTNRDIKERPEKENWAVKELTMMDGDKTFKLRVTAPAAAFDHKIYKEFEKTLRFIQTNKDGGDDDDDENESEPDVVVEEEEEDSDDVPLLDDDDESTSDDEDAVRDEDEPVDDDEDAARDDERVDADAQTTDTEDAE